MLLPMGLGTILVNIPGSTALVGPIQELYHAGIANELIPLLLVIGILLLSALIFFVAWDAAHAGSGLI